MKLSTLLILLAGLVSATTFNQSWLRDRRSLSEIWRDARLGKLRVTRYETVVNAIVWVLLIAGIYLAITWR